MDMESGRQLGGFLKKYKYVFWVALLGIFLMLLPESTPHQEQPVIPETVPEDLEGELARILSAIQGVGRAEVLLTEATGENVVYQTDTAQNSTNLDTVIVRDGDRVENGLVKQILPPKYRGALIVCTGGDSPAVRLKVVEAVKSVTGLPSDCITVLKMK